MKSNLLLALSVSIFITACAASGPAPTNAPTVSPAMRYVMMSAQNPPYSADIISETKKTLADGKQITTQRVSKIYRDSVGRTRTENMSDDGMVSSIHIIDLGNNIFYTLSPSSKTATRKVYNVGSYQHETTPSKPGRVHASKLLGIRDIEGVQAEGTLITTEIPAGVQGNRDPVTMTMTIETWRSLALNATVYSKMTGPQQGVTISHRTTNIKLDEPAPALFVVPSDYTIVDAPPPAKVGAYLPMTLSYTADIIIESEKKTADGNLIATTNTMREYHDSTGRIRTDILDKDGAVVRSLIRDTDGAGYSLDPFTKTATKTGDIAMMIRNGDTMPIPPRTFTSKMLGTRDIGGMQADGMLSINEIPANEKGNRDPMTQTMEGWNSLEVKNLTLYLKSTDPRMNMIRRATNIKRGEPAPALFAVPPDYTVVP